MAWAILDTSVYIGHWQKGLYERELEAVRNAFVVRHSAVVLSELRRGARTASAAKTIERLFAEARICWTPTLKDWWETGRLIRTLGEAHSWDTAKRRDFQNDALIALTARRYGATVVTANHRDFRLLAKALGLTVLPV
ncbi:MAG TPA: PIN domain-containing protein [Vicinamibacteria bacterium]|jgi:predicted nucleic acid-binding protein